VVLAEQVSSFLFDKYENQGTDIPKVQELCYCRIGRILRELISVSHFIDKETEDQKDHTLS
jgi:hypothetical protein